MRKVFFVLGILLLAALPITYAVEIYILQDLPSVPLWGWVALLGGILLVIFARKKDDVIHHHLPH